MKKGEEFEGIVQTVLFPNRGVVSAEGTSVIVKNTIPGQRVRFRVAKKKNGRIEGRLLEVLAPSPLETADPGCPLFPACGGCTYRTLPYDAQLKMKEEAIRQLLAPALEAGADEARNNAETVCEDPGKADALRAWDDMYRGIRPSPKETAYRNKMEYSFGDSEKDGPLVLGLHKRGSRYDILPAESCQLVHPDVNAIVACVQAWARETALPYYHRRTHEGFFRHLLVRRAEKTGEILLDLVTASLQFEDILSQKSIESGRSASGSFSEQIMQMPSRATWKSLLDMLTSRLLALPLQGRIVGILHTTNDSVADIIQNDHTDIVYGQDFFYEELLGLRFRITPFSFFQTNSLGAEVLYETAREFLGDVKNKTVFDLYSGTGTIAQILAPVAGKAVGVEIVEEAVEAAKENAKSNGLSNCTFLAGDVLQVLDDLKEKPDVIVLDPPRDGVHPKALPKILAYGAEKLLYISCKPSSLARDLPVILQSGYVPAKIGCVDLFPATPNTEVLLLFSNGLNT